MPMQLHTPTRSCAIPFGVIALSAALLAGCAQKPVTVDAPPPQVDQLDPLLHVRHLPEHAIDWQGSYQAVLPCTQCSGVAIVVQLRKDKTAMVRERRLGGDLDRSVAPTYSGSFYFDPKDGHMLVMTKSDNHAPAYRFIVGDGWLEMRERISGAPLSEGNAYRLNKTSLPGS